MSEPSPKEKWEFHSDGGGWSDVFVDKQYAGRMKTPIAKMAGDCVNAHAALVESCEAALEYAQHGQRDPFKVVNHLTAALAKARPKGKE